jgi:purine-nucleoside phosphorylase
VSDFDYQNLINHAHRFIASRWDRRPRFGIILGTGAGKIADEIVAQQIIPYPDVPHLPASTAMGHKGQFVCGTLAGEPVIAMQGRFHLYEGYPVDQATLPVHVMAAMGVSDLFISNAAGGCHPDWNVGDVMLIQSHVDFMFQSTRNLSSGTVCERPLRRSDFYDSNLLQQAMNQSRRENFRLHKGTYASMLGPNYETRAEYRFLRKIGSDAVGMSTVPEVAVAATYAMRVMGMSIITNIANPDQLSPTTGHGVVDAAAIAAPKLLSLVKNAIQSNLR